MSTAKPGLTIPFNPPDSVSKPPRLRKQRSKQSGNHQPRKLEKTPSLNSNLHNGLNNSSSAGVSAGTSVSNGNSNNSNNNNINNNGASNNNSVNSVNSSNAEQLPRGSINSGRNTSSRRDSPPSSEHDSESTTAMASAQGARTERSRGYLSSRTSAANRLEDGSSPTRRDNNSASSGTIRPSGSTGRLFDPKKDPVLVVPSTSATQQQQQQQANAPSRSGPADPRNLNSSSRKQQNHRLYDPNQAQPQSVRQDGASISSASVTLASTAVAPQTSKQGSTPPSPMVDGLVRLTNEIQTLEKKVMVMEQPSRRRLDSDDDDTENSQQSGRLTWNRRMDNSKRYSSTRRFVHLHLHESDDSTQQQGECECELCITVFAREGGAGGSGGRGQSKHFIDASIRRMSIHIVITSKGHFRTTHRIISCPNVHSIRLAAKYLKLIQLDFKSSLKHDIDTRCWKLAIYPLIETFRAALRNSEHTAANGTQSLSDSDEDHTENIRHHFTEFIGFAQEFYASLKTTLQKLEEKHSMPNRSLTRTGTPPRWHRSVGIMGDLARYRWLHKLDDDASPPTDWLIVARRLYREAIDLGPCNGKMYNQLALLSGGRGLESMYYYSKR